MGMGGLGGGMGGGMMLGGLPVFTPAMMQAALLQVGGGGGARAWVCGCGVVLGGRAPRQRLLAPHAPARPTLLAPHASAANAHTRACTPPTHPHTLGSRASTPWQQR